jgi:3-hydroxyisobutyrate dehydrogenase-like beta-hydroxyacid dehydrogenase
MSNPKITFIGLGKMGATIANKLLQNKFELTVYNRTGSKMLPLIDAGAKGVNSLQEAVKNADIIMTCVLDDKAILEIVADMLDSIKPGAIHIGISTIMPQTSKKLLELHQHHGSTYLAVNVLGIPKAAERGALTTIVAGDTNAINNCTPIFNTYSTKILNVGDSPYQANVMKICCNYFLVTAIESMGELYTFAEKSELNAEFLAEFFHEVFAHSAFKLYVDKIKERNFEANFELSGGFKDINLFQQAFTDVYVSPDIANVVKNKFTIAMAKGMAHQDWSAITEITRIQAGLS